MRKKTVYMVRATANRPGGIAIIWVGWRNHLGLVMWRWELLRVLWQAMGTSAATKWVVEQYRQTNSAIAPKEVAALEVSIADALQEMEAWWPSPSQST